MPATYEPRAGVFQLTIYSYQIACNEPDYMIHYILSTEPKTNTNITNNRNERQEQRQSNRDSNREGRRRKRTRGLVKKKIASGNRETTLIKVYLHINPQRPCLHQSFTRQVFTEGEYIQ